ncbi:glutamine-hydrolyzing GMP synthase subunit GuaA [Candidatus Micrarchaeota archaeon]|nr:glutamine-hydrolyzing GMP synthase subunit GuaA [Candidatus Micrarchaeota archaeon]MBD3417652.1 glutamine-hydrolyzing GMP synthase subunit GuaA [Candidatus Micrarchaeota archaeon]
MAFNPETFIPEAVEEIKTKVGNKKAVIAVSGGVDSMVAAALAAKAIPGQLTAIFVDTGFMRKGEAKNVKEASEKAGIPLTVVDESARFIGKLGGVSDPEQKRKIIGELFIRVFEENAKGSGAEVLIQGTIAPDWIESGGAGRDTIKSHHNVGGLPEEMGLELCEPLRELYKHEVRMVGKGLGLPRHIFERQPFPGPALAVRVVGEITQERLEIVREACAIVEEEIDAASAKELMERPWQYFAAVLPTKTVGVAGDERIYKYTIIVRAVRSLDGMTANFSKIPPEVLGAISTRITNEVKGAGRVLYDITNKPPSTIEME